MHLSSGEDFLLFSITRGGRDVHGCRVPDLRAVRATCRAGRDTVDASQFWQDQFTAMFPSQTPDAVPARPQAKADYIVAARAATRGAFWRDIECEALPKVSKALEHTVLTTITTMQLPMLPLTLASSPMHGALCGATASSFGVLLSTGYAAASLQTRPRLRALAYACGISAVVPVATLGAAAGAVAAMPLATVAAVVAPIYFAGNIAADFCGLLGVFTGLLQQPRMQQLMREKMQGTSL